MKIYGTKFFSDISVRGIRVSEVAYPPAQLEAEKAFIASLSDGTPVVRETTVWRDKASQKQRGAYFGLFCKVVLEQWRDIGIDTSYIYRLEKPTGIEVSSDELKLYLYSVCPTFRNGKKVTMRDMDTQEMASFFDRCLKFASSQWGIVVPEPDEKWRLK